MSEEAAAEPAAPAPKPAPSPPAPAAPAPAPAPEPAKQEFNPTMETPIEYESTAGDARKVTMGDLVNAHDQLQGLGDVERIKTLAGALKNDPESTRKLLQDELTRLTPPPTTEPATEQIKAIQDRLDQMQEAFTRSQRVSDAIEDAELGEYCKRVIASDPVKKACPYLSGKPDIGLPVLKNAIKRYRDAAKATGQTIEGRTDLLEQALVQSNALIQTIATGYGGKVESLEPTEPAAAGPVVTGTKPPSASPAGVVSAARQNPGDLLSQVNPWNQPAQPAMQTTVPSEVPAATSGGSPVTGVQQAAEKPGPYTRSDLLNKLVQQRAAEGASQ